jgi:low affinity Fe/Cu permease
MGVGLLFVLFLIVLLIFIFFGLFLYSKMKKSKVGIIITSIVLVCLISLFFINNIDELTISKADVKKDLKEIKIELNTNFEIKSNTVSGMPERYQKTEIEISNSEIEKIIKEIKQSKNFIEFKNETEVYNDDISMNNPLNGPILNFKYPEFYSRELYKDIDNISTRIFLTVYEGKNILEYQKMED